MGEDASGRAGAWGRADVHEREFGVAGRAWRSFDSGLTEGTYTSDRDEGWGARGLALPRVVVLFGGFPEGVYKVT